MKAIENMQLREISVKDHVNFIAAIFCFWFATYIYIPVFGVYLDMVGFSYSTIGIILGGYGVTQILLRFPLGVLSDFMQKLQKYLFVSGFIIAAISGLLLVYFDSFIIILISRLLAGVTASMWVMATVLYSYYFSRGNATKAMGIMQFTTVATQFLSMSISGYIVHYFGWHFPFWIGVVVSVLGVFFAWNIKAVKIDAGLPKNPEVMPFIRKTIRIPQLKMLTFLSLVAHAVLFITIFGFSPLAAAAIGVPEKSFIWLISAFFVPHSLASLSLTFWKIERHYNKIIILASFGITAVFLLLVPFANTLFSLSIFHAGAGLALGFIFPILLSEVVNISPSYLKMSAMGFYQSFYALGILFGPIVAGIVAEKMGLNEIFYFTGILSMAAMAVVIFLYRTQKTKAT